MDISPMIVFSIVILVLFRHRIIEVLDQLGRWVLDFRK